MQLTFEHVGFTYRGASIADITAGGAGSGGAGDAGAGRPSANRSGNTNANHAALHDISFTLEQGECLAIAGHSGSGKSTLAQHFNGLLTPTQGRVLWQGRDMADKLVAAEARQHVGLVLQYPERQLFAATVFEDVAFGPRNMGMPERKVKRAVHDALLQVGLDSETISSASPFKLSGGQQRRVAFAGVLAMRPDVLVFDEPASGLDPANHAAFIDLVEELHASGITCVVISHNMNDIARLATRVLVLDRGKMAMLDTPERVFARTDELTAMGLDIPLAQRFANELRRAGMPLPEMLYNEESLADAIAKLA